MVTKTERLILENQMVTMRALNNMVGGNITFEDNGILKYKVDETSEVLNPTKQDKEYEPSLA